MKAEKIENEIRSRMPASRTVNDRVRLILELNKKGARDAKRAIRTSELKHIHKNPQVLLAGMAMPKIGILGVVRKGAVPFLLNHAGRTNTERFLHVYAAIKTAREDNCAALLKHVEEDVRLPPICAEVLGQKDLDSGKINAAICHSAKRETDKAHLKTYNALVKAFKTNSIRLRNYDEFEWLRGSFSWHILPAFVAACS